MVHFIVEAEEEIIKQRIKDDVKREDKSLALTKLSENIVFLYNNYDEAIRINTDNRSMEDTVDEMIKIINDKSQQ